MKASKKVLEGIKQAILEGKSKVSFREDKKSKKDAQESEQINEASNITGSGSGVGGKVIFDEAFAALRYANPFRMGSREIIVNGSDAQFVAKVGNAANSTNPFGYTVVPNSGSPNIATSIWQLPVRVLSAVLPVRSAVLTDVNALEEALVNDLMLEFSQLEGQSMALNNDQSGSSTTAYGATSGLRGLPTYNTGSTASFGSSGTASTNGIHTIATVTHSTTAIDYDSLADMASALPAQYWALPTTAWHIHPSLILELRVLKDTVGMPVYLEVGNSNGGAVANLFGFPVIPNPYLAAPGTGNISCVLANWDRFMTIGDTEEMTFKMFEQTQPGFINIYAEKRMVSTIRDPFAGVFLKGV